MVIRSNLCPKRSGAGLHNSCKLSEDPLTLGATNMVGKSSYRRHDACGVNQVVEALENGQQELWGLLISCINHD